MNLFSRTRTPRTGIEPAFKIVMRTSKRPDGWDRKRPIEKIKIDQFWYPRRPVDVARDPMLSDAFIVQSAKHFIDDNVSFSRRFEAFGFVAAILLPEDLAAL